MAKRRPKGIGSGVLPSPETQKIINGTFDILEKKKELLDMWLSVQLVCQSILEKAKQDPASVKASLLREVINSLKALRDIIELAQNLDKDLKAAELLQDSPDGMTIEERQEVEEFEQQMHDLGVAFKAEDSAEEEDFRYKPGGTSINGGFDTEGIL